MLAPAFLRCWWGGRRQVRLPPTSLAKGWSRMWESTAKPRLPPGEVWHTVWAAVTATAVSCICMCCLCQASFVLRHHGASLLSIAPLLPSSLCLRPPLRTCQLALLLGSRMRNIRLMHVRPGRVFVNASLSAVQQRNLQAAWGVPVVDRTRLIVDIFAQRAQTKEAVLQVRP